MEKILRPDDRLEAMTKFVKATYNTPDCPYLYALLLKRMTAEQILALFHRPESFDWNGVVKKIQNRTGQSNQVEPRKILEMAKNLQRQGKKTYKKAVNAFLLICSEERVRKILRGEIQLGRSNLEDAFKD